MRANPTPPPNQRVRSAHPGPAGAVGTWDVVAEARWLRYVHSKKPFALTNVKTKTFHFESPDAEVIEEIDEDPFEAVVKRVSGVGGG